MKTNTYKIADLELEDLQYQVPRRHRTEDLAKLAKTTKFTTKEIQLIYRGFKQVSFVNFSVARRNNQKLLLPV